MISLGKISLNPSDFTYFIELHLKHWSGTRELEEQAYNLSAANFQNQQLINFIKDVCRWGNYPGIAGRVLNQNDISIIQKNFVSAWGKLKSNIPNVREAIIRINAIKNLGTPSFASKHLRFLRPQVCPVLDSIIWYGIGKYSFNPNGYEQFSRDCLEVADILQRKGIVNPLGREAGKWFAADIEMAIFEYLRSKPGSLLRKTHCREDHRKPKTENRKLATGN